MSAWRGWYHCNGNTYGSWLRGDERGWRARHHREHCEGDYKRPPPRGAHDELLRKSIAGMRRASRSKVLLDVPSRAVAVRVMGEALLWHDVDLIDLCADHVLARFMPADRPLRDGAAHNRSGRHLIGIAKKRAARTLSDMGLVGQGGVWGKRCGIRPVKDRAHQLTIARYIPKHGHKGAVIWSDLKRRGLLEVPIDELIALARQWRI